MTTQEKIDAIDYASLEYEKAHAELREKYIDSVRRALADTTVYEPLKVLHGRGQNKHCRKCGKPGHNARTCKKAK